MTDQPLNHTVKLRTWEAYQDPLRLMLADHTRNFADDPELFHATFYNRGEERSRFWGIVSTNRDPDRTIIITGGAGVGKTSFIYNIVFEPKMPSERGILPILADFRTAVPQNVDGCLLGFIRNVAEEFSKAQLPVEGLRENSVGNIDENVRTIHHHLKRVTISEKSPRVLFFLDDFDYAEEQWYRLLDYFLPFVQSAHCGVVLTMRPRLYATIQSYDERLRFYFGRNVDEISLDPMAAREVLASRLAPILFLRQSKSILAKIVESFREKDRAGQVIRKLGLKQVDDLPQIDFPFTERHNDFMQRITNGNLREVQDIALDSLLFILKAGDSLEKRLESDIERRVIGREGTLELFYESRTAHFRIVNINEQRSVSGNSLFYNVLESLKIEPQVDDRLCRRLRSFGHSEKDIKFAVSWLADRNQRLIEPRWLMPMRRAKTLLRSDEYVLTDKGHYYLDIAKWPEYQKRAGSFGKSFIEAMKP
jgi:hypothetical protein